MGNRGKDPRIPILGTRRGEWSDPSGHFAPLPQERITDARWTGCWVHPEVFMNFMAKRKFPASARNRTTVVQLIYWLSCSEETMNSSSSQCIHIPHLFCTRMS